ncbi:MAG: ribonuclease [Betaproteobacteria bacterium]|nr:MAG: ribonuclease [Betaproteobacteria bacterium]
MKRLVIIICTLLALSGAAIARAPVPIGVIPVAALPAEARATLALIKAGGPFPYAGDGSVFGNREKMLPPRQRGHYREYTVKTPGARDRGARRVVAGAGASGDVRTSGEYYYTDDHYNSFRRIRE